MAEKEYTPRGFRLFAQRERPAEEVIFGMTGELTVQESSLAGRGAHVWIRDPQGSSVQINVEEARIVAAALDRFIKEAEAGELVEDA